MTGEYTYVVPFMCAVLTAKLLGDYFSPSVYESHAQMNGYGLIQEQRDLCLQMCVADLAVALTENDLIDATKLVPIQRVSSCARRRYLLSITDSAFQGSASNSPQSSPRSPVCPSGNRVARSSP